MKYAVDCEVTTRQVIVIHAANAEQAMLKAEPHLRKNWTAVVRVEPKAAKEAMGQ